MLDQYKQNFENLSGLEINQEVHSLVESQMLEKLRTQLRSLTRLKQGVERSIHNFIAHQQQMRDVMQSFN
jgi:hypothetical protein